MHDATERWLPVVGWEGFYEVSTGGHVRSIPRKGSQGRILKPGISSSDGYPKVALCRDGKHYIRKVHHLVLEAFIGPRPSAPPGCGRIEARHLDGNPANNRLGNLAWGTSSENGLDTVRHGNHVQARKTHCPQGHEYTPENTYTWRNHRDCRTCRHERYRRFRERRKGAADEQRS